MTSPHHGRHLGGWRRQPHDPRDLPLHATPPDTAALPSHVDLGPTCPPVRDQGQEGSCTANAGAELHEHCASRLGTPEPLLSRQMLYYDTRVSVEGTPASEDSGAFVRDVLKALARYGCATEDLWPYSTPLYRAPTSKVRADAVTRKALEYRSVTGLDGLRAALAAGLAVQFGFDVPAGMMTDECARTGVVPELQPGERPVGGHSVLAVGYDDARALVRFQNSWGTGWGDGGFGYLPYSYLTGGHADDLWVLTRVAGQVTPQPGPTPTPTPSPTPVPPFPAPTPATRDWLHRLLDWVLDALHRLFG